MAEERLINEIEDEFHQIMELVYSGENFLLSGGAGTSYSRFPDCQSCLYDIYKCSC